MPKRSNISARIDLDVDNFGITSQGHTQTMDSFPKEITEKLTKLLVKHGATSLAIPIVRQCITCDKDGNIVTQDSYDTHDNFAPKNELQTIVQATAYELARVLCNSEAVKHALNEDESRTEPFLSTGQWEPETTFSIHDYPLIMLALLNASQKDELSSIGNACIDCPRREPCHRLAEALIREAHSRMAQDNKLLPDSGDNFKLEL